MGAANSPSSPPLACRASNDQAVREVLGPKAVNHYGSFVPPRRAHRAANVRRSSPPLVSCTSLSATLSDTGCKSSSRGLSHRVPSRSGAATTCSPGASRSQESADVRGRNAFLVKSCERVRGGCAFGCGDVSVHRCGGSDPSVGGGRRWHAGGAGRQRRGFAQDESGPEMKASNSERRFIS